MNDLVNLDPLTGLGICGVYKAYLLAFNLQRVAVAHIHLSNNEHPPEATRLARNWNIVSVIYYFRLIIANDRFNKGPGLDVNLSTLLSQEVTKLLPLRGPAPSTNFKIFVRKEQLLWSSMYPGRLKN